MEMEQKLKSALASAEAVLGREHGGLTLKGNDLIDKNGNSLYHEYTVVDHISKELGSGGVATIFAKDGDDYRRVTTSITDASGNRAVDTLLDRDGPVYPCIKGGKDYSGKVDILGTPHLTEYMPIFAPGSSASGGDVIGILFVGIEL